MNNKIDVTAIMKELEGKIQEGLSKKKLTLTDISLLMTEHIEKAKAKIVEDVGNIVQDEVPPDDKDNCEVCNKPLKKTKKKINK